MQAVQQGTWWPVKLPDGKVIEGPRLSVTPSMSWDSRGSPNRWKSSCGDPTTWRCRGLRSCKSAFGQRRVVTVESPYNSWMWYFSMLDELLRGDYEYGAGSNCCWGGDAEKWYALLNNCEEIQQELRRPNCPGHEGLRGYDVTYNRWFVALCD